MTAPLAELTSATDRFTLLLWRALRRGERLPPPEVERLRLQSGLDREAAAARLATGGEHDDERRLIGFGGLSAGDHPHRLTFDDRVLSAWCAWDPFFLVPSLGGDATLETSDPVSGETFAIRFVDGRAEHAGATSPARAPVLSMVERPAIRDAAAACDCGDQADRETSVAGATVEDLWASFCNHVHLFGSARTAREFFDGQPFELLSLAEASALAEQTHGHLIRAARVVTPAVAT